MSLPSRLSFLLAPALALSSLTAQEASKPAAPAPSAPAGSSAGNPATPASPDGSPRSGGRRRGGFGGPPGAGGPASAEGIPEGIPGEPDGPRISGNVVEPFQFPNNSVSDLLAFYERLTGMTLIEDTAIFDGSPISLVTTKSMDKTEAIRLVEATLLVNGYAIVVDPSGKSARILPTRDKGSTTLQFSQGVKFYTDPKDIPEGETLVTYFMKLEHVLPEDAGGTLANHVGLNVFGRITPVTTPPGLLITESATIVRHLIAIRDVIDVVASSSSLVTKFIKLEYADSATVAQIVQATLDAQAKDKQTKGVSTIRGQAQPQRSSGKPSAPAAPAAPAPGAVSGGHLDANGQKTSTEPSAQVIADTRLNQILVVASPQDFTYVSSLIEEFDKPVEVPEPYEHKLNYVFAIDVLSSLADLLKDTSTGTSQLPGGGTINTAANQQPLLSSSSQLLAGRKSTNTRGATLAASGASSSSSDSSSGGSAAGTTSVADSLIPPQEDNAPVSILVNKTRLIADPMSNTIFVMGSKESVDKVSKLLEKLDRKPPQVYLATVIGELTLDKGMGFGIDYISKFHSTGGNTGFTSSLINQRSDIITNNNIADMTNNLTTKAFGPATGLNLYGQLSKSVDVYVNALETSSMFKVLSRPTVFALNNKKATITSGSVIPVPSQSITAPGNANVSGAVTTTVAFRQVVLKLEVVPLINPNNEITLTIAQTNDTVTGTQLIVPNNVPIIGTEQIITTVTVPSGHTVALGGLISETHKKNTSGLPFISRIPVLGSLLKNTNDSMERKELIIFIQPQVVSNDSELSKASLSEDLRTGVGASAFKTFPQAQSERPTGMRPGEKKSNWFHRTFGSHPLVEEPVDTARNQ